MGVNFPELVKRELAFLVDDYGFSLTDASAEMVRFTSPRVVVAASYFPAEGQVDVSASLVESDDPHARFLWSGMVGRASVPRLMQLAAAALLENPAALRGDEPYYREVGAVRRREAEAWTAFYEGRGPRPTGKLP